MKKRITWILAWICLGTAANVGVAWWFAARAERPRGGRTVVRYSGRWPGRVPQHWPAQITSELVSSHDLEAVQGLSMESTTLGYTARTITASDAKASRYCTEHRFGWPFRALARFDTEVHRHGVMEALDLLPRPQDQWWGGVTTAGWAHAVWESKARVGPLPTVFPLIPIGLGFVLNTSIYGAALWVPFAVVAGCRRRVRRKRGLCIGCGYPTTGLAVCPECGRRVSGSTEPDRSSQQSDAVAVQAEERAFAAGHNFSEA